eukprot:TRINITY_DN9907_c0_g1_i1.p1 TRINITY_DN9907_c0_g1~~TRINITY_DN9907_c0_g1_i1.p1  ORF type:complete len:570 (-),score=90.76 TRINITY_DN9907_c0_g1_i1:411-2120(-)
MGGLAEIAHYPRLWCRILKFYFSHVHQFGRIHKDLPSRRLTEGLHTAESKDFPMDIEVNMAFKRDFNAAFDELAADVQSSVREPNYEVLMGLSWLVRIVQCSAAWLYGWQLGLLSGLLQFVVAPLSLTGCLIRLLTNFADCVVHYALNGLVAYAWSYYVPTALVLKIVFTSNFVIGFFVVDFILNLFVYFRVAEQWAISRLLKHMAYGTFNTKTYFVVVFGCLYLFEFDLGVVLVTSAFTYIMDNYGGKKFLHDLTRWPNFPITFYVEHRIGHMPIVYQHAHKMHHYLHDTTSFDGHIYGSGMNEEFFWILAETLPCILFPGALFPYFLNLVTLHSSWTNKGAHSRVKEDVDNDTFGCYDADNFHADHHTYHRCNFGSSYDVVVDFYFGTDAPGKLQEQGTFGMKYSFKPDPLDDSKGIIRVEKASAPEVRSNGNVAEAPKTADVANGYILDESKHWSERCIPSAALKARKSADTGGSWIALHGAVFDVSVFQRIHPGGAQILSMHSGSNATKTFDDVGHSPGAKKCAAKYIVGLLDGVEPSGFVADILNGQTSYSATNGSLNKPLLGP